MPIYTYRCENCGVQFDRRQKFSDDPLTTCPECETETLHKVYQPVGILFKGSGFYSTDNRSSNNLATPGKNGSHKSESESSKPKAEKSTTSEPKSSTNKDK